MFVVSVSYNQCHSSIITSDFRDYSWVRLGLGVGKWSRLIVLIKMFCPGSTIC